MYLDSAYCALPPSMAFGWYGVCVTWIPCFLIARLFKSISTHFLCLFARSSQVRVNTNDRQQSNVKAFYNTSHLDLTINHPRATNYPERLIKIHFTDIICDWTVGGPRKSSELARRLKSYWPLHLDLTLAGRSGWARISTETIIAPVRRANVCPVFWWTISRCKSSLLLLLLYTMSQVWGNKTRSDW